MKRNLQIKAIELRKQGLSYNEILREVNVAKSTLSCWLHQYGLSKYQKQRLTAKKLISLRKGLLVLKEKRASHISKIKENAQKEVPSLINDPLWILGTALYWAEGAKERQRGQKVAFSNSDPNMVLIFLKWLKEKLNIPIEDITFDLYIHESCNYQEAIKFWSDTIACDFNNIKVYFKRNKINPERKYSNVNYHGQLRITIKRSNDLNRIISSWVVGINKYWGIV